MKLKNLKPGVVKLPAKIQLVLYLIKEELKTHKFFDGLRNVGLDDCYYQSDLSTLILTYAGLKDDSGDLYDFYNSLLNHYGEKIDMDNDMISEEAFNFYVDLIIEKKKRSNVSNI